MRGGVLLDTGPLVAGINRRDRFHEWAKSQLGEIEPPLLTCEAVFAESCFLLQHLSGGSRTVAELVNRKIVEIPFRMEAHAESLARLLDSTQTCPCRWPTPVWFACLNYMKIALC